jgi:hypothetical protein
MDIIGYHQRCAVLAQKRGDHLSAARHNEDDANGYPKPEQGEGCRQLAEQERALHEAERGGRKPS